MPDLSNSHETLTWLVTGAGLLFWATFTHGILENLRSRVRSPLNRLTSLQMYIVSTLTFFVPLIVVQLLLQFLPDTSYTVIDPWLRLLVMAFIAYSGQQIVHWKTVSED